MNFCLPVALGVLVGLLRLPALLRNPRDPLLRSVGALLLTAVGVFVFAAVPMIAKVNEVTGVPNFAAPLVYSLLTACAGSGLVLVINWRGGRPGHILRAKRWCIGAYCAVCAALFALFALGSAPVERLRDFDTYYAGTAYIREMIVLYLLVHTVSALLMSFLCWRWLREVSGELRVGLALIVVGYSLSVCFDVCKFTAIGARWAGLDWDYLSTDLARGVDAPRLARRVQRAVAVPVAAAWDLAVGQDVFYPEVRGGAPTLRDRILARYVDRLVSTSCGSLAMVRDLTDVTSLQAPLTTLVRPRVLLGAVRGPLLPPLGAPQLTTRERTLLRADRPLPSAR
ncbi:hypothetical protein ACFWBI_05610 [Streptomyces sp. NPDC059982]|uniref:hypothetical protein n=1 Tax=unclassified Streptomyces TaxID=2593676 RepID=UPI0036A85FC6